MADSHRQLREFVRGRAGDRCEYCRLPQSAEPNDRFHLEHVIAEQHGGPTASANLAWACQPCNLHKGTNLSGIDPESKAVARLFDPRADLWEDHFARLLSGSIVGRTPTGRATVAVLAMNRNGRPRLRVANP